MRIYIIAFTLGAMCMQVYGVGNAQVFISESHAGLPAIFSELKKQTGYTFFYDNAELKRIGKIKVALSNATLEEALSAIFADLPLDYEIVNKTVVVKRKYLIVPPVTDPVNAIMQQMIDISGTVRDTLGQPLRGATIMLVATKRSVLTDESGFFILRNISPGSTIRVSFIGYQEKELVVNGSGPLSIVLLTKEQALNAVTINAGIFRRNRETFTGATATFSGDELRRIGNQNVIQSLKALDPSFVVLENNLIGSNPNALPVLELRGKTSVTTTQLNDRFALDPNQPLFVLNGFETTLEKIFNLDINRVASITILKDAASTAIYGSRAANGVVVVETIAPMPGELRLQYSLGTNINIPDLRSYNLMDAAEKLEFERLSGRYSSAGMLESGEYELTQLYNARLAEVERGVNTYWLSEPLRNGISDNHSLSLSGGNEELAFGVQGTLRNERGVMKGSDKKSWGGTVDLTYRRGNINVSNGLYISGSKGLESPYGNFSTFAQTNPYYRKYAPDGSIPMFLDSADIRFETFYNPNPLYNASLNNINNTKVFDVQNNLSGYWDISRDLRLGGGLQLLKTTSTSIRFIPPEHTSFSNTDVLLKGAYTNDQLETSGYEAFASLTYSRVFGTHSLNGNVRGQFGEMAQRITGFSATGFPFGTNGNPAYAFGYTPYNTPEAATRVSRRNSVIGSFNYAFDQRYLVDAVYSIDGSSNFGLNNLFKPFWSVGLGWNLHREAWLKPGWLNTLRLRGNMGSTGNQALGAYTSTSVYSFITNSNLFGQSLDLQSLGNPDLAWQTSINRSIGVDFGLLEGRISGYVNYFSNKTDPLLVNVSDIFPSSVGIALSYPLNMGKLTTSGWEAQVMARLLSRPADRFYWTVTFNGAFGTKSVYGNFGDALDALNKEQLNSNGLIRYHDGYSPDDIWAVVSRGIDPASGREIFQKKDGTQTFTYDPDDIVRVGNTRPDLQGNIGTSVSYKAFTLGINASYLAGAWRYNQTLYNKVENLSATALLNNQDRRALYDRWKEPGDIAQFRGVQLINAGVSPVTSRFIQRDNFLHVNSLNFSWRLDSGEWLKRARIHGLSVSAFLNDVLRYESILFERGTGYPFQRTASVTLNVNF